MPRILLSEGSSLSARETITALGSAGQCVELLTSDPLCLGRFSRFVTAVHHAPPAGSDPSGYLEAALNVIRNRKIDVLIPVHEQAYLFAAKRQLIASTVGLALASFRSFEQVQSKEHTSEANGRDSPNERAKTTNAAQLGCWRTKSNTVLVISGSVIGVSGQFMCQKSLSCE